MALMASSMWRSLRSRSRAAPLSPFSLRWLSSIALDESSEASRIEQIAEIAQLDQLLERALRAIETAEQCQRFAYRLEVLQRRRLELDPDHVAETAVARSTPVMDRAAVGVGDAFEDLQRRGLAGPVGTEQAEASAFPHTEADAIDGADARVGLGQVVNLDYGCHVGAVDWSVKSL